MVITISAYAKERGSLNVHVCIIEAGFTILNIFTFELNGCSPETCWVKHYWTLKLKQFKLGLIWDFLILI